MHEIGEAAKVFAYLEIFKTIFGLLWFLIAIGYLVWRSKYAK